MTGDEWRENCAQDDGPKSTVFPAYIGTPLLRRKVGAAYRHDCGNGHRRLRAVIPGAKVTVSNSLGGLGKRYVKAAGLQFDPSATIPARALGMRATLG